MYHKFHIFKELQIGFYLFFIISKILFKFDFFNIQLDCDSISKCIMGCYTLISYKGIEANGYLFCQWYDYIDITKNGPS